MNKNIGVAAVGDVLDINCWSSTPYFFYKAGEDLELFNQPWRLNLDYLKTHRIKWNLKQLLTKGNIGGFQYSDFFLNIAEKKIPQSFFSSTVISFNQLFPRSKSIRAHGGRIFYYIDLTLVNLFNEKEYNINVPNYLKEKAIEIEKENYIHCDGIVTMGKWIHDTLIDHYKISESKLFHILPGANIKLPQNFQFGENQKKHDLVIGFVGKDWKRKGLDKVIEIKTILSKKGYDVIVKVIGHCPEDFFRMEGVEFSGFINKNSETQKFIDELSACDIGCLFSSSEALGISVLEFLRLGIPVAGYDHQGMKDTLLDGASLKFQLNQPVEEIALAFEKFILNKNLQQQMRKKAQEYSNYVTWERCVNEWKQLL